MTISRPTMSMQSNIFDGPDENSKISGTNQLSNVSNNKKGNKDKVDSNNTTFDISNLSDVKSVTQNGSVVNNVTSNVKTENTNVNSEKSKLS